MALSKLGIPAIVTALYHLGHQPNRLDDGAHESVVLGLELGERTYFIMDRLPVSHGSALHRLFCIKDGYARTPAEVKLADVLGTVAMVDLAFGDDSVSIRSAVPFPAPPKYSAPTWTFRSSHPRFTGGKSDEPVRVGGSRIPKRVEYPSPPSPRSTPKEWGIQALLTARASEIPPLVFDLVRKSAEWAAAASPETKNAEPMEHKLHQRSDSQR